MKNGNEPAAPAKVTINRDTGEFQPFQFGNNDFEAIGLTKREYFAGLAMQALLSDSSSAEQKGYDVSITQLAEDAVAQSDAILAELERTQ